MCGVFCLFVCFETGSHDIAQVILELTVCNSGWKQTPKAFQMLGKLVYLAM